jgi:hypothetical protein
MLHHRRLLTVSDPETAWRMETGHARGGFLAHGAPTLRWMHAMLNGIRVLIVEDEPLVAATLSDTVEHAGGEVAGIARTVG